MKMTELDKGGKMKTLAEMMGEWEEQVRKYPYFAKCDRCNSSMQALKEAVELLEVLSHFCGLPRGVNDWLRKYGFEKEEL